MRNETERVRGIYDNMPIYETVGFRHEGRTRDALWWEGTPHDTLLMAALAPDWDG